MQITIFNNIKEYYFEIIKKYRTCSPTTSKLMIKLSAYFSISETELELMPIRIQSAGGSNIDKLSSAMHLRFNIGNS